MLIWNIDYFVIEEDAPCDEGRDVSEVEFMEIYYTDAAEFDNDDYDYHVYGPGCVMLEPVSPDESGEYVVTSVDGYKWPQEDIDALYMVKTYGADLYVYYYHEDGGDTTVLHYHDLNGFQGAYDYSGMAQCEEDGSLYVDKLVNDSSELFIGFDEENSPTIDATYFPGEGDVCSQYLARLVDTHEDVL